MLTFHVLFKKTIFSPFYNKVHESAAYPIFHGIYSYPISHGITILLVAILYTYKHFVFNPNPKHKCHWATLSLQNVHKLYTRGMIHQISLQYNKM